MRLSWLGAMALAAAMGAEPALANSHNSNMYWVYCIHGRIRIESRPPADVGRSYISSSLCTLQGFRHNSDARSFAQRNWGGEGGSCACR